MFRQKTKSDMKLVIRMVGLAVATAWGISTAIAEPINTSDNNALAGSIQLNDASGNGGSFTSVSTAVDATLYQGFNDSAAAPTVFGTADAGWGQTGAAAAPAFPTRSLAPVSSSVSSGEGTMTADQRAQCGFRRNESFKIITPVPEPTTLIAGGLLLLPFAASALRLRSRSRLAVARRAP
jgi:hypothetical protein